MLNKIFQGAFELVLAVAIILVFDKIIMMSFRGLKLGMRKLINLRRPVVVVEA